MQKRKKTILAVDPIRREMGVCVLEEGDLLFYAVKTLRRESREDSAKEHLLKLAEEFDSSHLVMEIKKLKGRRRSPTIAQRLRGKIKSGARTLRLRVCEYSTLEVKKSICKEDKATRREVARKVAETFPELKRFLSPKCSWRERYWQSMFNSVALGITHYQKHEASPR